MNPMRKLPLIILIILVMFATAASAACTPSTGPCFTGLLTVTHNSLTRYYGAYYPAGLPTTFPLIVVLHGAGDGPHIPIASPPSFLFENYNQLTTLADANQVAILWAISTDDDFSGTLPFPECTSSACDATGQWIWQLPGYFMGPGGASSYFSYAADDIGYIASLITATEAQGADSTRILLVGFSTGAIMAHAYVQANLSTVLAAGVFAGPLWAQLSIPPQYVPAQTPNFASGASTNMFIVHGTNDATLDYCNLATSQPWTGFSNGTSAAITSFSITSNVVTFQAANSFTPGEVVFIGGLSTTTGQLIDNQSYSVLPAGLSDTEFEVNFTNSNVGPTSDSGTASTYMGVPNVDTTFNFWANGMSCSTIIPSTNLCRGTPPNASPTNVTQKLASACNAGKSVLFLQVPGGTHHSVAGSGLSYTFLVDFWNFAFPNRTPTTTMLVSSLNPSTVGQSLAFTATVSGSGGTPSGTVVFMDGTVIMGQATLSAGQAIFNKAFHVAEMHPVTAVYSGNATFAGGSSAQLDQVVNQATTTTTLVSAPNPSTVGQTVVFTATVAPPYTGTPTGTVTFKNGATTMGTVVLSGGQAIFNRAFFATGTKSITANYSGDTNFTPSSGELTQTVN
jgi:poly(3-hydroxybutyrate) depolymerase